MIRLSALAGAVAGALTAILLTTDGRCSPARTSGRAPRISELEQQGAGENKEIDRLKRELERHGPEARRNRESAVAQLLVLEAPAAHRVLQEKLLQRDDRDGVIVTILDQLLGKLRNPRDAILGETGGEDVKARRASYLPALITLVGDPPEQELPAARETLLAFESWERLQVFQELLARPDEHERVVAARAAGRCQDFTLSLELANHMADPSPQVREAVNESMWRLTFHPGGFRDKQAFLDWYQKVNAKSFTDLAEDAALRADAKRRQELTALSLELIDALMAMPNTPWARLGQLLLGGEPEGLLTTGLRRMCKSLRGSDSLGGSPAERLALVESLAGVLSKSDDPNECAALLATMACLVAPAETEQRDVVVTRLLERLSQAAPAVVRAAALAGLRRFPSAEVRDLIVNVARVLRPEDHDLRQVALATLHAKGWSAPNQLAPARGVWLELVEDSLSARWPLVVRQEALAMLSLRDDEQQWPDGGFEILRNLVADPDQDVSIRELALIQLEAHAIDGGRQAAYSGILAERLEDPAVAIRLRAASLLPPVVATGKDADSKWLPALLSRADGRLLEEPDEAVHGALTEALQRIAEQDQDAATVMGFFSEALAAIAAASPETTETFRRAHLVEALRILATDPARPPELWLSAAEVLCRLGERTAVRVILSRHAESGSLTKPETDPKFVARAHRLTLCAALLRPMGESWSAGDAVAEANSVLAAVSALEASGSPPENPEITALLVRIRAARGEDRQVVALAESLPRNGDNPLSSQVRRSVALAVAKSYLALDEASEAVRWLQTLDGDVGPAGLALLDQAAVALLGAGERAAALPVLAQLVQLTPSDAPEFLDRFLDHNEVVLAEQPEDRDALRERLDGMRDRFMADDVSLPLQQRFQALLKTVQ